MSEIDQFPIDDELKEILHLAMGLGLNLILIGGTVRDFLAGRPLKKDFDFEIVTTENLPVPYFLDRLHKFKNELKKREFLITDLPFSIIRASKNGANYEFSPPRVEHFLPGVKDHKNFRVEIVPNLDFNESSLRRDFTINAMGICLFHNYSYKFLDPHAGLVDLRNRILKQVSNDFSKDPVRFLRAIRFKVLLGFNFHQRLVHDLSKMDLTKASDHYFREEAKRSENFGQFLKAFLETTEKCGVAIPSHWEFLKRLPVFDEKEYLIYIAKIFFGQSQPDAKSLSLLMTSSESLGKSLDSLFFTWNSSLSKLQIKKIEIDSLPAMNDELYLKLAQVHQALMKLNDKINAQQILELLPNSDLLPNLIKRALITDLVGKELFLKILNENGDAVVERRGLRFYAHLSEVLCG